MAYPMGEAERQPVRVDFDRRIKLEFHGARITSDGGLLAYRELDEALGLTDSAITKLLDGRRGRNTRHKLSGLSAVGVRSAHRAARAVGGLLDALSRRIITGLEAGIRGNRGSDLGDHPSGSTLP